MTLSDVFSMAIRVLKALQVDFTSVGMNLTVSFYDLFWASVVLTVFFCIFWSILEGGGKK